MASIIGYSPRPSGYHVDMIFDIEATGGRSPSLPDALRVDTGSLMMIGFCPVRYKIGNRPTSTDILKPEYFYIEDSKKPPESPTMDWWLDKNVEVYNSITSKARDSVYKAMDKVATYLMRFLLDGDTMNFWAYPIGYDWVWLQSYFVSYSKYYSRADMFGLDLGFSPRCIRALEHTVCLIRGSDIVKKEISNLPTKITHLAHEDALHEANVYIKLLDILYSA